MDERKGPTGHEPVDSASPAAALKARIVEMAKLGQDLGIPSRWKQRETQNGFNILFRTNFVPEASVTNFSNDGLAVLVKDIYDTKIQVSPRSEPFISYIIRINKEEGPVLLINRDSIIKLREAKDTNRQIGDLEDSLSDFLPKGDIPLGSIPIKLNERHSEFLQKFLDSLDEKKIELVEDDSSSSN